MMTAAYHNSILIFYVFEVSEINRQYLFRQRLKFVFLYILQFHVT